MPSHGAQPDRKPAVNRRFSIDEEIHEESAKHKKKKRTTKYWVKLSVFDNKWIKSNGEATNKVVKDDGTFRERHVLSRFLVIASNIINNWSIERDPSSTNAKLFTVKPTICLNLWTSSYQWAKSTKDVICRQDDVSKKYYIPARNLESISQADLNKYVNRKWTTFNHFKNSFDIWCLEIKNGSDWKTSRCTCPAFLKNYICKHIVGMGIRLKLCKPPPAAKNVPIGAKNEIVWGWHIQPVNGTTKKAPLAFLIHGGPQASWYDAWTYVHNFQVFASQGYAVIAINFHGSDSYGQNFTDSIKGQYGTFPYEDLQIGLQEVLQRYSYIDENRVIALGGSYGGYMVNWIAGHPEMSQRFKTLISAAGLFDLRAMAYSMDTLVLIEHEVGGFTPYGNPDAFEKYNPINHVANWSQPMLIIHCGHDYRVPDTQGISAFTALQRRGIPSRMLYFPTESHAISNPHNSLIWHQEVFDWMNKWIA
ncbi:unnamed protein product [Rotaria socialis]|uniref:SWIM-type domain-containing protein n=1 Tax=Rotaria socialis TaxID=392032 RepID=A0A820VEP0_9BILA|nr:unnamed protein product [Rotaria socialis]CAF4499007.1 unnamed protein product [Rotaria socialis]